MTEIVCNNKSSMKLSVNINFFAQISHLDGLIQQTGKPSHISYQPRQRAEKSTKEIVFVVLSRNGKIEWNRKRKFTVCSLSKVKQTNLKI